MKKKIKKAAAMPKDEILFRIKEKFIETIEYIQHRLGKDKLSDEQYARDICKLSQYDDLEKKLTEEFQRKKQDRFFTEFCDKKKRQAVVKAHFDDEKWISEAENIWKGNLTLLGEPLKMAGGQGWHIDPLKGIKWPDRFYTQVNSSDLVKSCDIKYVWEMNRHQYLIVPAKAYWLTGNEKYAEKVFTAIEDWIAENPYNSGVNWTSSLELAVRAISWIWTYFFCQNSVHLTPRFNISFMKSLYEHAKHIQNHLSFYSSPYNHLIGEAAALHIIGSIFPQFDKSEKWENLGWNILADNVDKQFHADGMCVEQASFYHHFTLGFYLQSVFLRRLNSKEVPENIMSRLEKALEFSMHIAKPDGKAPMIGDIDNARSLYFSSDHSWDFRSFLGLGAILFKRSDFKQQCDGFPEEVLWLCSDEDIDEFIGMEIAPPLETSGIFPEGGYFIFRDSWSDDSHYLCFDCGEISDGLHDTAVPSAAHGHADALSFELSAYGKSFLVDSGFHTYFGDMVWHRYFRQEEAHNTLKIAHYCQAEYCGRLTWQNVKKPVIMHWKNNSDSCSVSGYIEYDSNVKHQRDIVYVKRQFWFINDTVTGNKGLGITCFFHFDPAVTVTVDKAKKQITACRNNTGLIMQYFNDCTINCKKNGELPSEGWTAPGYGMKLPGYCLEIHLEMKEDTMFFPLLLLPLKNKYNIVSFQDIQKISVSNAFRFKTEFYIDNNKFLISLDKSSTITLLKNDKPIGE